jgi:hypothetical protein
VPLITDPSFTPVSIMTDDGMTFRCSVAWVGRDEDRRWIFVDRDNVDYIGPPCPACWPMPAPGELRAILNDFWMAKRALGQAGMNARLLRRKLLGLDN